MLSEQDAYAAYRKAIKNANAVYKALSKVIKAADREEKAARAEWLAASDESESQEE